MSCLHEMPNITFWGSLYVYPHVLCPKVIWVVRHGMINVCRVRHFGCRLTQILGSMRAIHLGSPTFPLLVWLSSPVSRLILIPSSV